MISATKARRSQERAQKTAKSVQKYINKIGAKVEVKIELGSEEFFALQSVEALTEHEVDLLRIHLRNKGYNTKAEEVGGGRGLRVMW